MSESSLHSQLDRARKELLDLTARNRLLNTPRHKSRTKALEIVDELSDEIYRILVVDEKRMSFLGAECDEQDAGELGQPPEDDDEDLDERGVAARHSDTKLQTGFDDIKLQKKLLSLFYDARTAEEEQGVNILYLAIGFLEWTEAEHSDRPRHAPLILVPCSLTRRSAGGRIQLEVRDDEITTNLSLHARLHADFGLELPELPDLAHTEDFAPSAYFDAIEQAIAGRAGWQVHRNDMVLSFFSFSKFLMYRDLDAELWPESSLLHSHPVLGHPVLGPLLGDGFEPLDSLWPEDERLDVYLPPSEMVHVMDADSSQTEAIEEVKAGRNLVIQGPPGTGKSQTITNLVAAAVMQGKKVLFVAEKLAALEVVRERLDSIGLGRLCLELHSRKSNKKAVLGELQEALESKPPRDQDIAAHNEQLHDRRRDLNAHADALHGALDESGLTPYRVLGELVRHLDQGTAVPTFQLADGIAWSQREFAERQRVVEQFCAVLAETGPLAEHPWRGVTLDAILPTDLRRLQPLVPKTEVQKALETGPANFEDAARWSELVALLRNPPDLDRELFATDSRDELREIVSRGVEYAATKKSIAGVFRDKAWEWDSADTRHDLDRFGRSMFRIFRGAYRTAKEQFLSMTERAPSDLESRLRALGTLEKAKTLAASLPSSCAFGALWNGADSDWEALGRSLVWLDAVAAFVDLRTIADQQFGAAADACEEVVKSAGKLAQEFAAFSAQLPLDLDEAFGVQTPGTVLIDDLMARAKQWSAQPNALPQWVSARQYRERLKTMGLESLLAISNLSPGLFSYAYYEGWMREVMRRHPALAQFDGRRHEGIVEEFRRMDRRRIELARIEVARKHYEQLPKGDGEIGELGIVRKEIKKKRRHLPLRKLMDRAGSAIQRIKPVFMMSPLSVAQYLAPGQLEFDLLLIDEASQVQPVDAFGAVLRSKQIVVVGDERQLPPTNFFGRAASDDDVDDDDLGTVADIESILGVCSAAGMRDSMLNWHYRSQHQSLIAVSNKHFYGDRLFVVPSPFAQSPDLGLKFHHVEDGVFDRGGRRDNRVEARRVAVAAIDHARQHPGESLGIGTFSVAQRDAILNELELLWRTEPDVKSFFASDRREPFFVKNLENIQGDERDVIFISVGYARDSDGYFAMNFGPLQNDGGERRLNVLITRAKRRCNVFSSIQSGDVDLSRARSAGAAALREYLAYAEAGSFSAGQATGRGFDSPFEEQVARALENSGFTVVPQVGLAGFYIDLAIVDPQQPGRFLLGIECDGASYHSSRSARDRDRLRQQVLESRGWTIHRIWSTDWFNQREDQLRKTVAAIEAARSVGPSVTPAGPSAEPEVSEEAPSWEVEVVAERAVDAYVVADFSVPSERSLHELETDRFAGVVAKVVEIEGPVCGEVIVRRVTKLWGLNRAGGRVQDAISSALTLAVSKGQIREVGPFEYDFGDRESVRVRDRSAAPSEVRKSDNVPATEIAAAIQRAVEMHVALDQDDLARAVARMLGFRSTSSELAAIVGEVAEGLESVEQRDGVFRRTNPS